MGADSKIQWTHHTFNPWRGCAKVSPGCAHCYAETLSKRNPGVLGTWGKDGTRAIGSDAYWRKPLAWNRAAEKAGERRRVFCASLADVFEDRPDLVEPRRRLFALIEATPHLDWLLLTKRPENIRPMLSFQQAGPIDNLWLGTTVENQEQANLRIPLLLQVPAAVRFLSVEPLLGPVNLARWLLRRSDYKWLCCECCWGDRCDEPRHVNRANCRTCGGTGVRTNGLDWVIVGGESGPGARPCDVAWIRSVVEQCREAGVPCFVKQVGAVVHDRNDAGFDAMSEVWADGPDAGQPTNPSAWPEPIDVEDAEYQDHQGAAVRVRLSDPKGGDPEEWPMDLRVRQFPEARS